jgi:hypothetical protein
LVFQKLGKSTPLKVFVSKEAKEKPKKGHEEVRRMRLPMTGKDRKGK